MTAYYPARLARKPHNHLPQGKRLPRGWSAVAVGETEDPLLLTWHSSASLIGRPVQTQSRLRITVALDYRDAKLVEAFLPESGVVLGSLDIRYAYVFQPFELTLTADQTEAVLREGVGLRVDGGQHPLWIFDELNGDAARRLFAPHLLIGEEGPRLEKFIESMASLASLQPFGWLEGCVLDGLYALRPVMGAERIDPAIEAHLGQYLDSAGQLHYEDLHGRPADGAFTTIEATLPLGVIVKYRPDHPVISRALEFWDSRRASGGGDVIDGRTVTAEGSYTVAYPLAAIASRLAREDLAGEAVRQTLLRRDWLAKGNDFYLRYDQRSGERSFRNWARALAWYTLGMTRTWIELKQSDYAELPGVGELEEEIRRIAEVALSRRQPNGLWSCFTDEPDTGIDTSGSAGIAAALALGANYGLLPQRCLVAAGESLNALVPYLTPDGILSGVAQHNAGGPELQRCGYRVMSQMGMGLMAQLYAAIRTSPQ